MYAPVFSSAVPSVLLHGPSAGSTAGHGEVPPRFCCSTPASHELCALRAGERLPGRVSCHEHWSLQCKSGGGFLNFINITHVDTTEWKLELIWLILGRSEFGKWFCSDLSAIKIIAIKPSDLSLAMVYSFLYYESKRCQHFTDLSVYNFLNSSGVTWFLRF